MFRNIMIKFLADRSKLILLCILISVARPVWATEVTVYKSPTCGCCKDWVKHMQQNGFKVKQIDVDNVVPYKIKYGVTQSLSSCHTARAGGYTIEGHVPAADIKRLLKERPKIKGLAVPGMPAGSPGMEGPQKDKYDVLTFDAKGKTGVFAKH